MEFYILLLTLMLTLAVIAGEETESNILTQWTLAKEPTNPDQNGKMLFMYNDRSRDSTSYGSHLERQQDYIKMKRNSISNQDPAAILCVISTPVLPRMVACPGSCFIMYYKFLPEVGMYGCSPKKHVTGIEEDGNQVYEYCNTDLCT